MGYIDDFPPFPLQRENVNLSTAYFSFSAPDSTCFYQATFQVIFQLILVLLCGTGDISPVTELTLEFLNFFIWNEIVSHLLLHSVCESSPEHARIKLCLTELQKTLWVYSPYIEK